VRYAKLIPEGRGAEPWIIADDSLARGAGARYLVSGWPSFSQSIQVGEYPDAAHAEPLNRRNRKSAIARVVSMEFEGADECFEFVATVAKKCPEAGVLELGVVNGFSERFNCVVQGITPREAGMVAVDVEYQLQIQPIS
jgi:hypothetical protein